ncbi:MAG: ATP-binding protein [Patescibacteria group bacterium]|jgi:signal transduction histidine kinase
MITDILVLEIISLSILILGLLVYLRNTRSILNRAFFALSAITVIWNNASYLEEVLSSEAIISILWRIDFGVAPLIGFFFLLFTFNFPRENIKLSKRYLIFLVPTILIIVAITLSTNLVIQDVQHSLDGIKFVSGPLYFVYAAVIIFQFIWGFYILFGKRRKSSGIERLQIKFVLYGILLTSFIAVVTNLIIPQLSEGPTDISKYGIYGAVFFIAATSYAITKYRLMDIRLVIRRGVFYSGLGIFVVGAYYLVAWSDYSNFGGPFTLGALLTAIVFAPLFLAGFVFMSKKLKQLSNKYFFASLYDYQETLDKFSKDVSSTINLTEVANVVVDTIQQTMQMDNIGLFVKNKHYEPMKIIGFNESNLTRMVSNSRCTEFISSLKKPLVYDELVRNAQDYKTLQENIDYAKEQLKNMDIAIVLPLVTKGDLISCIILGKKISRDAYTKEDMRLLESLANHAAISIENARLYNEIQGFNETLKYKVDDATKRLRELLKIKSDFLTVASHQLRTPTSIVRGMLSLVIEEKDLPNDERERFISQAYEGINRLERIIHELLNATELEGKKMQMDFKKVRIENIIEEIVHGLLPLADQLKVKLVFDKPVRPIPKTLADPTKLKEAITNIVDNAVHYTAGGNVNIFARRKENQIVIEVSDNGIGMTKNDLRNIFTKFTRGEGILQVHPNGTGLGLFIAKKMLEAMGGTITAESKGKNKGSKFTLTIPIK